MAKPTDDAGSAVMEAPAVQTQKAEGGKPKAETAAAPKIEHADQVFRLPIGEFRPSPTNPRKHFDADKLKEIGETMKIRQLHAVLGRRVPGKTGIELIAGECRWRAGTVAGLTHLNAVLIEADDVQVLKLQLIENMQRKDITALEEARAIQELMKRAKYNVEACAKELKLEQRTVYNRLELLKLPEFVLKKLEAGIIAPAHAAIIAKLPTEAIQKRALEAAIQDVHIESRVNGVYKGSQARVAISVRDLEAWVALNIYRELSKAPWKLDDAKLCQKAGACLTCSKRTAAKPVAFPDTKKDSCLDDACFDKKMDAFVAESVKSGLKAVSSSYYTNGGALNCNQWNESKASNAVEAVVVDGARRGEVIKIAPPEKPANSPAQHQTAAKEKAPREREEAKAKYDVEIRTRVVIQICGKVKALGREEFEMLAAGELQEYWIDEDGDELLVRIFGWDKKRLYGPALDKKLKALSDVDLARYTVLALLSHDLGTYSDGKRVAAAAKRYKVDVAAIEKAYKAELAAKEAPAVKTPDKISGKDIAAKIKAARSGKTPKAKKK